MTPRTWTLALVLTLAGCGGGSTETTEPPAPDPAAEPVPVPNPETPAVDATELAKEFENITLVPSPVETQKALEAAGIQTQLATLVQKRDFDVDNDDPDNVAVRTGVVIADMLLTVKSATKEDLLKHLTQVDEGMQKLNGGSDIAAVIRDLQERIKGDSVTREELLVELDELSGAVIPELEFNGQERIVPLIKAGSWLEGANLVARAVKDAGRPEAADALLKQPAVVDYFLKYVRTEGADKAPAAVTEKLETSLTTLKGIAERTEPLTGADVDTVISTTNDVLALL